MSDHTTQVPGLGLVVGGTGMLAGTVADLATRGWKLLVPGRRRRPVEGTWIQAEWSDPAAFAARVAREASAPLDLLVAWAHEPHRNALLTALGSLLRPGAPVVEVWGSASEDPLRTLPAPVLADHPTHQAVPGYQAQGSHHRWLTNAEISRGVSDAVTAALAGQPPVVHEVGTLRPWPWGR